MMDLSFNQYLFYFFLSSSGDFVEGVYTTPNDEPYTDDFGEPYTY